MTTANQTLDRLRKELHDAFRRWMPIRRHTIEELEHLARNLMLRTPTGMVTRAAIGAVMGGILAAPFTFGASLGATVAGVGLGAAGGGLNAVFRAGNSNLSAEEEQRFRLAEVQGTIDSDRRAPPQAPWSVTWLMPSRVHRVLLTLPFCQGISPNL